MCLAIYQPIGARITHEEMSTAWANNPDGAGFTYVADGSLVTYRTRKLSKLIGAYDDAVAAFGDASHFMVHFRYATHGTTNLNNVHPFAQDEHTMVIHNGILPTPTLGDGRSDTATFVQDYLPRLGATWFDDPHMVHMVSEYCAGSKLVVMTTHPDAKYGAYIINEPDGVWDDRGMWFSNQTHCATRSFTSSGWSTPSLTNLASEALARCTWCGADAVDNDPITDRCVCYSCGACATCGWDVDSDCDCTLLVSLHTMTNDQWQRNEHGTHTLDPSWFEATPM